MREDMGAPSGTGSRASHEAASSTASSPKASIPSAAEDSYRMNPHFRRFLDVVGGDIQRAVVAWAIAKEAFRPVTPEAEFEVWQDDAAVAGCSGPRDRALAEAVHYAVVYQTDEAPCVIQEVTRMEVNPDQAEYLLASAIEARRAETVKLGSVHESVVGNAETPNLNHHHGPTPNEH